MRGVYLLHFEPRYKHAGHYLGFAEDILRRVHEHEMGKSGARLTVAAANAGSALHLVRVWPSADRDFERSLKGRGATGKAHRGSLARLCPVCKANALPSACRTGSVDFAVRHAYSNLRLAEDFGQALSRSLDWPTDGDQAAQAKAQCYLGYVPGQPAVDPTFESATDRETGEVIHFFNGSVV